VNGVIFSAVTASDTSLHTPTSVQTIAIASIILWSPDPSGSVAYGLCVPLQTPHSRLLARVFFFQIGVLLNEVIAGL
jgi:hypothetical protein